MRIAREVKQIAFAADEHGVHGGADVYALCSDDTIWVFNSVVGAWRMLPPIPPRQEAIR